MGKGNMRDLLAGIGKDKQKLAAILLCFAVLLYVDFSFILKSQVRGVAVTRAKVSKLQSDIQSVKRDLSIMQQSQGKAKAFLNSKKIATEGEMLSLLEEISLLARNNAVRVTQINPQKGARPSKTGLAKAVFIPVLIKLDLSCGYHNLGAFISDIENSVYAVSTEDIKIMPDNSSGPKERVILTLKTYVKS